MADQDDLRVLEVTIRYEFDGRVYELTIPDTTRVNAIFLDRDEASSVRQLGVEHGLWEDRGSPVHLHPAGGNWAEVNQQHQGAVAANLERLEEVPAPIWSAEHTKRDVCVHDERCMWFCLDPR